MDNKPSFEITARPRRYTQVARAAATEAAQRRIVDAFADALRTKWMDEITLDGIAASAGTTRQTVIRMFGGKEGLLRAAAERFREEIEGRCALPPSAGPQEVVRALLRDYEAVGDLVNRLLAQEGRQPVLASLLEIGRRAHRAWVAETFGPSLTQRSDVERETTLTQLVVATDAYTWKLLRRDLGHTQAEVAALLTGMITKLIGTEEEAV